MSDDDASRLVSRREAEPLLGYSPGSLKVLMQQQPGRWPEPAACRLGTRELLFRLGDLLDAAPHGATRSRRPDGADEDGLVTCLSCGRRLRSLGPHLARSHDVTAAEYRAEHHLPATTALMATDTRAALSTARRAAMADDPELVARMRAATPPLAELARRSADARSGTDELPRVRAARRDATLRTLPAAHAARRERLEAIARAAGYASMADAIDSTRGMPSRAAAEHIGVGASTIKRWRAGCRSIYAGDA